MFDEFCRDNHIGPVTKKVFREWINDNRFGYECEADLDVLWSGYLEEEKDNIYALLSGLRKKRGQND